MATAGLSPHHKLTRHFGSMDFRSAGAIVAALPALEELATAYPGRLRVIEGDALALDLPRLFEGQPHIVSNLPYNIGTALLVRWLGP